MTNDQKVAVITGGSRGIGRAIALRFAQAGYQLVLNARSALSTELMAAIEDYDVQYAFVKGDITHPETAPQIVSTTFERFGRLDVLVNNAGITNDKLVMAMAVADFETVIDVNLVGTFRVTQVAFKKMLRQRSGCIINLSSVIGQHGNIGQANYAASKAGVIGLTQSLAKEGALRGVRCNAIAPGMITTEMTAALKPSMQEAIQAQIPLQRFGTPEEVADAALFLAENTYVTGQVLTVDGGMTI
ncbi:3-oxoacyl-[acyl-carrier-protein] reductase [Lactobacillus curvatus]|uniref:3-oxoacyl-[acyl-carrier-protein] reductase n=1 Tax=Latilactobacillus fragifolii TaxID=2814244 RepID=UPI0012AEED8B|nr:3-oxoacyl-[acyl-carrier-protein] reductase [Latilactobacillus fragifolii]MSD82986.1 3-oxoacyl-[acyl-carrier-protein] reductase [Latilactobacillus curvatus]MSE23083.1 3-oxoacyl-[acyl-carrier-protein] reductase [Latilactobacillus curvatus]